MYHNHDVWFLSYGVQRTEFFVILDHFFPFYPPNETKNQNFEKMKNKTADIINLHKDTKNYNHMLHYSWDTVLDENNVYFSFWAYFELLPPLAIKKSKFKIIIIKKQLEIIIFWLHDVVTEIWCMTDGWTDRWKKWHIEVGVPPKNLQV